MSPTLIAVVAIFALTVGLAAAQPAPTAPSTPPPAAGPESPPAQIAPAAPGFKVGTVVTDRTGARLGPVTSFTEAPEGPMVVIEIDAKMVSVPAASLSQRGEAVVSRQTKAEILAAAGAPN